MKKPVVFFSHSSRDHNLLLKLKELFIQKTGGSIEVFLSSDGQSIPLGRNWVHRIQEALENASLMIVFISPSAFRSNWIFFESGFAYAKGIRVVPVGILGVDLGTLPPPLGLLQGFNITSQDGLDNLIALVNDEFKHNHSSRFSSDEYQGLVGSVSTTYSKHLGEYATFIDQIEVQLDREAHLSCQAIEALKRINGLLLELNIEHRKIAERVLHFNGVTITAPSDDALLKIKIDPLILDISFPLIEKAIRAVRAEGVKGINFRFDFLPAVQCLRDQHKITARIYDSGIRLGEVHNLLYKDLEFSVDRLINHDLRVSRLRRGAAYLSVKFNSDQLSISQLKEVLDLLFEREILFLNTGDAE